MKFILITILVTIVNCITEDKDLDPMNRTRIFELVDRLDDQKFQEISGNISGIKNEKNPEDVMFRHGKHNDYEEDEYDDESDEYDDESDEYDDESDEYDDESDESDDESDESDDKSDEYDDESDEYDDESEEYDDESDEYDDESKEFNEYEYDLESLKSKDESEEYDDEYDYSFEYYEDSEGNEDKEEYPALVKLKELLLKKTDATVAVKFHNFTTSIIDPKASSGKGLVQRFLGSKNIHLFYIVFIVEDKGLFDIGGKNTIKFDTLKENEVIKKKTDLVAKKSSATLDIKGKVNMRLQFSLGKKENSISTRDGTTTVFFDPELRINYDCFMYSVLGIVYPTDFQSKNVKKIMDEFSKATSNPKKVEKFIEDQKKLPDYLVLKQGITTGAKDTVLLDMYKNFIKGRKKNAVEIGLYQAAEALYKQISKEGSIQKHTYSDIKEIPEKGFASKENAKKPMKKLFKDAMEVLKDKAAKISKGGDMKKIQDSIMKYFKKQFQKHRKLKKNKKKFREVKNYFGVFKKQLQQKVPS